MPVLSAAIKSSFLEQLQNTVQRLEFEMDQAAQVHIQVAMNARDEALKAQHAAEMRGMMLEREVLLETHQAQLKISALERQLASVVAERDNAVGAHRSAQAELATVAAERDDLKARLGTADSVGEFGEYTQASTKHKVVVTGYEWSSDAPADESGPGPALHATTLETAAGTETEAYEEEEGPPAKRRRGGQKRTENTYACLEHFHTKPTLYLNREKWEFKCKYCNAVRRVDRTVGDGRNFADEVRVRGGHLRGFQNVSGHVRECEGLKKGY